MLTALDLLKEELKSARETFEGTVSDIKKEHLHKDPGGTALPLAAAYAHLVLSEDLVLTQFIKGTVPLFETTWKDKTGVSALMPPMDENWNDAHLKWAKSLKLDLTQFKKYEKAVYAQTENYISSITNEDLEKEIDLGAWGTKKVYFLLSVYVVGHIANLAGELSAIKGVFGSKGYQF